MRLEKTSVRKDSTMNAMRIARASVCLAAIGLVLATPAGCSQPAVRCTAALGEGLARYTVKGKVPAECASSTLPGSASPDPAMIPFGVESYVPSPADPNAADEVNSMAIKAEWLGTRIQDAQQGGGLPNYPYPSADKIPAPPPFTASNPPSTSYPFSWGTFDSVYPDASGICHVSSMTTSKMTYPDIPAHDQKDINGDPVLDDSGNPVHVDDQPETAVTYEWTNVRTYVAASSIGVQTFADLAITQDGCKISYTVSILVPKVGCASASDPTKPDPALCDPNPNGPNNPYGSGISEDVIPSCENISADPANPDFECMPPANDPKSNLP
jgi:hypothetical protein